MKLKLAIPELFEGFAFLCVPPVIEVPSHHHDELEFGLVMAGHASYLMGKTHRLALTSGSMIWLFPKQEHLLVDCSRDFAMWVLMFRPEMVRRLSDDPDRQVLRSADPGSFFCRQLDAVTRDRLGMLYKSASTAMVRKDYPFANTALAHALLASWEAYRISTQPSVRTNVHPAVAKAAHLISDSDEALPLPEIATRAGLSGPRLSRLFKKQMGVSLAIFRQQKCVERFLRLYGNGTRYSVTEAALMAGFGSYPQFYRVFQRHMNQSPSEYARKAKEPWTAKS